MLSASKLVGFALTTDATRARAFYEGKLGLRFVGDDGFALSLDSNGNMIRLSKVKEFAPAVHTVLGWEVTDIAETVSGLQASGVDFERFGFLQQDEQGIWDAPGGARVAWFKDPDGNVLSLSQHP